MDSWVMISKVQRLPTAAVYTNKQVDWRYYMTQDKHKKIPGSIAGRQPAQRYSYAGYKVLNISMREHDLCMYRKPENKQKMKQNT